MNKKTFCLLICALSLTSMAVRCDKVHINPNDSTPPTVEFKIKEEGGQDTNAPAEKSLSIAKQLALSCTADDPDGIKSVALEFSPHKAHCTVGGNINSFFFDIIGLPSDQEQQLQGDSQGNVLTRVPLFTDVGAFSCQTPDGTGSPYGAEITITCKGQNWSSNNANSKAQKTMVLKLH